MDISNLRTFLKLAEEKNFTRTAAQLYISQSTVTNRISALESELGRPLFNRSRKNVTLTEEGLLFLDYARRIVDLEDQLIRTLSSSGEQRKPLRIGTTNTFYECYLAKYMKEFLPKHTDLAANITIGHTLDLLDMLQGGSLDVTFTYSPLQRPEYICRLCNTDDLTLVTHPNRTQYMNGITKKELPSLPYLFCNFALQEVGQFIRELFPPFYSFPLEIDNSTKLVDYLLDDLGASFLPRSLASSYIEAKQLLEIPLIDFEAPKINSYISFRRGSDVIDLFPEMFR